jgi:hypothetical protein
MEKFIGGLLIALGAMAIVAFVALIGGTIVYLIWPVAIPAAFPGLVESGTIAGEISWWGSVCITWLCSILIKSSQTNNNSK